MHLYPFSICIHQNIINTNTTTNTNISFFMKSMAHGRMKKINTSIKQCVFDSIIRKKSTSYKNIFTIFFNVSVTLVKKALFMYHKIKIHHHNIFVISKQSSIMVCNICKPLFGGRVSAQPNQYIIIKKREITTKNIIIT